MPVYDDQKLDQHTSDDDLRNITGISKAEEEAIDSRASQEPAEGSALSSEQLANAEETVEASSTEADNAERDLTETLTDQVGKGYSPSTQKIRGKLSGRQKGIIGGVIAFAVTSSVAAGVFFPILRLEKNMKSINQRALALASTGVENRVAFLLEKYMVLHMISMERCGAVRSIDCRADYTKQGIATSLFKAWQDVRIEQRLFDNYGVELRSSRNANGTMSHRFYDRRGNSINIARDGVDGFRSGVFQGGEREAGREMRLFLKDHTKWYQVMERRSVRKYLTRKHGMNTWCFFACKERDSLEFKKADVKTRFKIRFVERVVYPFSSKYGFIMECLVKNANCTPDDLRKRGIDATRLPDEDVKNIVDTIKANPNTRLSHFVIEGLLKKIGFTVSAKSVSSTVPVVGQIYLGLTIIDAVDRIDACVEDYCLSKFAADVNVRQYLEYYVAMRSANDEMKAGESSLAYVGELVRQFNGAEESRIYKARTHGQTTPSVEEDATYLCADGEPIPSGEFICKEKKIYRTYTAEEWRNNRVVKGLLYIMNIYSPGGCDLRPPDICSFVRPTLEKVNSVIESVLGPVIGGALSLAKKVPGLSDAITFIESKTSEMAMAFFTWAIPLPVNTDSPGRERYDALEGGAEIAGIEFAKGGVTDSGETYGTGAKAVTDPQASLIYQEYLAQKEYEYKNSSIFARLTSFEYPQSFANRVLGSLPAGFSSLRQGLVSVLINNPFKALASGFANMLSLSYVGADSLTEQQMAINPFGVTRHAYEVNDPAFTINPEELTEERCEEIKKAWQASKTENPVTGLEEYSVSNPCLLERVVVETAGGIFGATAENIPSQSPSTSGGTSSGPTTILSRLQKEISEKCNSGSADAIDRCSKNVIQTEIATRCKYGSFDTRSRCATSVNREVYPCYGMTGIEYNSCYRKNYPENWAHIHNIPPLCRDKEGQDLFKCLERS